MQKKNQTAPLPTNITQAPDPLTTDQNIGLQLPSADGTSELAPSTLDLSQPPPQKINQNILNQIVQKHLAASKFPESTDTYFNTLEKYGYSKDQIQKAKDYNSSLLRKHSDATETGSLNENGIVDINEKEKETPLLLKPGQIASDYIDKSVLGMEAGTKKAGDAFLDMQLTAMSNAPLSQKIGHATADVVHIGKGLMDATFSAGNVISPELAAFNAGIGAAKSIPESIKSKLYDIMAPVPEKPISEEERANKVDEIIDLPFTAPAFVAAKLGYNPAENSWQKDMLDIAGFMFPIALAKVGGGVSERIQSINDLKNISQNIKEATPDQIKDYGDISHAMQEISPSEVKVAMIKDKLNNYSTIPNAEIMKMVQENETPDSLKEKSAQLTEKINEEADPQIKDELTQQQATLNSMSEAMKTHEEVAADPKSYIDAISKDETISPLDKEKYIDQITNSAQMDASLKEVEQAKIEHITNVEALRDPGSKEFYDKAMQALDDPKIVDRVRESINEAVKAGEMDADDARDSFDKFKKAVEIDKTIPKKINDPEDRIEASKLIEKKDEIKESVKGKDPILAAEDIERSKSKLEKIDEDLEKLKIKSKEKSKETREHSIFKNALSEIKNEELKKGFKDKGVEYVVQHDALNESEAKDTVELFKKANLLPELEKRVLDNSNKMSNTSRGTISAILGKHYFDLAENETDPKVKEDHYDQFYNYTKRAAEIATQGGQAGNAVGKIVKKMYANHPETIIRELENKINKENDKILDSHKEDIKKTYDSIKKILESEEGKNAIDEEIKKRSEKIFGKETQKKIIDIFDKAKIDTKGKAFDATVGVPISIYNGAVEVMKQATLLGAKGAFIIENGINYIKENHKEDWNEDEFKRNWTDKLKSAGVDFEYDKTLKVKEVKSDIEKAKEKLKKLEDAINDPQEYLYELEKKKSEIQKKEDFKPEELKEIEAQIKIKRKELKDIIDEITKEKTELTKKENLLKKLQNDIDNPEEYIKKLEDKKLKSDKNKELKSDEIKNIENEIKEAKKQLSSKVKKVLSERQKTNILDEIEKKANRLNEKNKSVFLKDIISEVEKKGGLSEDRFVKLYSRALGLEEISPEFSNRIRDLAENIRDGLKSQSDLSKLYDKAIQEEKAGELSEETKKELKEAKSDFNKLARKADLSQSELSSLVRDKKDFADTFISLMQTNVLTPISLARNIVGVAPDLLLIRPTTNIIGGGLDFLKNTAARMMGVSDLIDKEKINPIARTKGAWLATPDAFRNAYTAMLTGENPNSFGERNSFKKIEPGVAAKRLYDALQGKSKLKAQEWVSSILESTAGVPGALIGRGLIGPDIFIRTITEQASLYEAGISKGLKGEALDKFVKLPEGEALEKAKKYADDVTFQGDNKVSKIISHAKNSLKSEPHESALIDALKQSGRILGSTLALYVKTPTNVLYASLKLLYPELSLAQGLMEWKKGNKVEAQRKFGQAFAGLGVRMVVSDMSNRGIITPATNYKDKSWALEEDGGSKKGGQINYSRMLRFLSFQDTGEKPTDTWVDYKWLGPLGLVMGTQAAISQEESKAGYGLSSIKRGLYALKYTSELPYISSMGTLANTMQDPEKNINNFLLNTAGTITSGVIPRTITQVSQSDSDYKKSIKDNDLIEAAKKKMAYDYQGGEGLPDKVSLWGEKVDTAPADKNKLAWYVFNFYKDRNPDENSLSYKIQELYSKTKDDDVIPSKPKNSITIKKDKVVLNDKEYEDYQVYVGKRRAALTKGYLDSDDYKEDDDDKKIKKLQTIYRESTSDGKQMLINSNKRLTLMQNEGSGDNLSDW